MHYLADLSNGIGIIGGTFDPIHLAHVEVARAVKDKYGLSGVAIIPAFQNPLRENETVIASPQDRLVMAYLATLDEDWLFVDPIEVNRGRHQPGPSFTIDTLNGYRNRFPNLAMTLITGADNVALHKWKEVETFPQLLVRIVAVARPDYEAKFKEDLEASRKQYPLVADMVEFLADINLPTSSTAVRESLRSGKIPGNLLHPDVANHIRKYGLYGCREVCEL